MADSNALFGNSDDDDDSDDTEMEDVNKKHSAVVDARELKKKPDSKTLFGDSDDDDDDDDDDEKRKDESAGKDASETKKAQPYNNALFGDDSSDEDVKKPKIRQPKSATKEIMNDVNEDDSGDVEIRKTVERKTGLSDDDDDDNDSDDAQFDDVEAKIVGLSSKTKEGAKAIDQKKKEQAAALALAAAGSRSSSDNENDNDEDDEDDTEKQPTLTIERPMTVQEIPTRPNNNHKLFMTKLPNILGIQPDVFDAQQYSAEAEEDEFGQASFNLIRWRYKKQPGSSNTNEGEYLRDPVTNKLIRESNTRLIEWEDGSYTLHVGNECFQVDLTNSSDPKTGFAGLNGYLYLSQTATYGILPVEKTTDDEAEEKKEETAGTVLECMGGIASRFAVRPSSLQSEAHKSLTVGIRQKTIKKARITEIVTQEDPEKLKQERIKVKQDIDRAESRKKGTANAYRNYPGGSLDRGGGGGGRRHPRMNRSYLEGDDEDERNYDTTNIRAMKKRTMADDDFIDDDVDDDDGYRVYDDDDDDEEDETFHRVRPGRGNKKKQQNELREKQKRNALVDDDDDDDDDVGVGARKGRSGFAALAQDDDDDEDEIMVNKRNATKKRSHQAVLDDDDDDSY